MTTIVNPHRLIETLCGLDREAEWLEFKENWFEAEEVGQYLSALANSAMFCGEEYGYLIFGVNDENHEIVGTKVRLSREKVGGEPFENWVNRLLHPSLNLRLLGVDFDDRHVELIVVEPAYVRPVRFKSEEWIRIGQVKKSLKDFPERERSIWVAAERFSFEGGIAQANMQESEIFDVFDVAGLFSALKVSKTSKRSVIEHLIMADLIKDNRQGTFDATNLLAITSAKDLRNFPRLARKAPRVVVYTSSTKLYGKSDISGRLGYAAAFVGLLSYVMERIPQREEIVSGKRRKIFGGPEKAFREIIANALIHQDLTSIGDGPLVEIFTDRAVISSPGRPLVAPERFIDAPPKSRNEKLAILMKQLDLCEGRGSGIDRALEAVESMALPPPLFQQVEQSTVVTIFFDRSFRLMTKEERLRACYQHAALRAEMNDPMSNSTLRVRLGLSDRQISQVSDLIRDALDAGLIKKLSEDQGNRVARYLPHWR